MDIIIPTISRLFCNAIKNVSEKFNGLVMKEVLKLEGSRKKYGKSLMKWLGEKYLNLNICKAVAESNILLDYNLRTLPMNSFF